jgi:hypothetical protein
MPLVSATPEAVPTATATIQPTAEPTLTPIAPETPQQRIERIAKKICGDRLIEAVKQDEAVGPGIYTVRCWASDGFTDRLVVAAALMDIDRMSRAVFEDGEAQTLVLALNGKFVDKYGAEVEAVQFGFTMTRALFDRITWNGISRQMLGRLLSERAEGGDYKVVPLYRDAWDAYIAE